MEFYKDLLTVQKNKFGIVLGLLFIALSLALMAVKIPESRLNTFDIFYIAIMLLNGIMWIFNGRGYRIEKQFGKAYIKINEEIISYKPLIYKPKQEVNWEDINSIQYSSSTFNIKKKDQTSIIFSVGNIDYNSIQEMKNIISLISQKKNILYNGNK